MSGNAAVSKQTPRRKPTKGKKGKNKSSKPGRLNTNMGQGIYIPASRVKHFLDPVGLNKPIEDAINELRDAEPHDVEEYTSVKNEETGKTKRVVTGKRRTELKSWNSLSEATRNMVGVAKTLNDEREKKLAEAEKKRAEAYAKLSPEEKKIADEKAAKAEAEKAAEAAAKAAKAAKLADDIKSGKVDPKKHPVRGPKKVTKYSAEIELLSKMRTRIAKDAPQHLAAVICTFTHERVEFAMQQCIKQGLKMVKERHGIADGHDALPLAALIRQLPSYKAAIAREKQRVVDDAKKVEEKKAAKKAAKAAEKAMLEMNDAERKAAVEEALAKKAAEEAAKKAEEEAAAKKAEEEADDEEDDETKFGHYVMRVVHNIQNERLATFLPKDKKDKHPYEELRISAGFRDWMSEVIIEFIRRFCPLVNGQIKAWDIKTVSREIVRQTVNIHLEIDGFTGDDLVNINSVFHEKFDKYQAYLVKRKADKEAKQQAKDEEKAKKVAEAAAAGQPVPADEEEEPEDEEEDPDDEDEEEPEEEPEEEAAAPPAPAARRKVKA